MVSVPNLKRAADGYPRSRFRATIHYMKEPIKHELLVLSDMRLTIQPAPSSAFLENLHAFHSAAFLGSRALALIQG